MVLICRMYPEAAKVALEHKNQQALEFVHSKCFAKDPALAERVANMMVQLGPRK
jgi:hypothetical protein